MKYIVIFFSLLFVIGCADSKTQKEDSVFRLMYDIMLSTKLDVINQHPQTWDSTFQIGEMRAYGDFAIFDTVERNPIYYMIPEVGRIEIVKVEPGKFIINEFYDIPTGKDIISAQINKLVFEPFENKLYADISFKPDMWYLDKHWDSYVDEYNDLRKYSDCNLDSIPLEVWDQMKFLMFNLSLSAINGSRECDSLMRNIKDDFRFVFAGEFGFYKKGCDLMLGNRQIHYLR